MTTAPPILIVTVAFRSELVLPAFLASIPAATTGPVEVIIVNNHDVPLPILPPISDRISVRISEGGGNIGYGAGINRGVAAQAATSEWIVVSNPDLTFAPGSIDELIRLASSDLDIGAVGPMITNSIGEVYPSARRLPSLRNGIGHALFAQVFPNNPWTRDYLADREDPPRLRDTGWVSGACLLVPRRVFESIRGFDESYFMYFEDVDFSARIGQHGYRVVYDPAAIVVHIGGESTKSSGRAMLRAHHESAYRYLSRRYARWYLAPLRLALFVGLKVRSRLVRS